MIASLFKWLQLHISRLFQKKAGEEKQRAKVIAGQTPLHILMNILIQIALILVFVVGVKHEVFPKPPDVKDYPGLGEPGGPISVEAEPVMPFKRYPPGFDVFGCVCRAGFREEGVLHANELVAGVGLNGALPPCFSPLGVRQ
jgi:hypothetical protein